MSSVCGVATTSSVPGLLWRSFGMEFSVGIYSDYMLGSMLTTKVFSGASFMSNILRCIFGHNFTDIPNHIPESVGITTSGMLAFFLFWLVHFPFCAFRPYQLRAFFWFKSIVVLPAVWGLFIFCMVNTKANLGSVYTTKIEGNHGWFIMYAINSGMGNTATLITNQPDIARWSKTRTGAQWPQLITNPLAVTLSASLGILATAAINNTVCINFNHIFISLELRHAYKTCLLKLARSFLGVFMFRRR